MRIKELIRKKRNGGALTREEIEQFVAGLSDGSIASEQVAALAMAVYFNSMNDAEISALTRAMARSGEIIDWSQENLPGPVVDKHSTGGVGDKVSFALAPIAAACGCFIPMISGRGLGHSGGTLDKIESVPGYDVRPDIEKLKAVVKDVGCAIVGQTDALAPADRRLYAIRDVTATVESIPLITASILSKKIAGGNSALIMDIKTGSGAFMPSLEASRTLGRYIVAAGAQSGLETRALITDMGQPLGRAAGNAVEIREALLFLTNTKRDSRLNAVVTALSAELLMLAKIEIQRDEAVMRVENAVTSGAAAEVFARMLCALGGPNDFVERFDRYLPEAKVSKPIYPDKEGYLAQVDTRRVGDIIVSLGGGREHMDDKLDLSVGFTDIAAIGEAVGPAHPLAIVHAGSDASAERAVAEYKQACKVTSNAPEASPVIYETII